MFLTKKTLKNEDLQALLENVLIEMNDRMMEKLDGNEANAPVRLALSLSANGTHRVHASICMCPDANGDFVPTKCAPNGKCP